VGWSLTNVMPHSSVYCHQKHADPTATESRRLHEDDQAASGAVVPICSR